MKAEIGEGRRFLNEHVIEVALACVTGLATLGLFVSGLLNQGDDKDATFVIDILVAVIILSGVAMKLHFNKIVGLKDDSFSLSNKIGSHLEIIKEPHLARARKIVTETVNKLEKISVGIIPLTTVEYHEQRNRTIDEAGRGWKIYAVSSINPRRWKDDPHQALYQDKNLAAKTRGAIIERIFALPIDEGDKIEEKIKQSMIIQQDKGITIYLVSTILSGLGAVEDFVIFFDGKKMIALKDYPVPGDETRILHGELITSTDEIHKLREEFDRMKQHIYPPSAFEALLHQSP
jgi:hypothetical protein